ncbi:MAG: glycosyltransferase [Patescibacteria group bacterium]
MKKLLIISVSAGSGHVRAAEAIEKTARLFYPKLEAKHIDLVDYTNLATRKAVFGAYAIMASQWPELYGFLYRKADTPRGKKQFAQFAKIIEKMNSEKLLLFVKKYQPDYVLCTHLISANTIVNFIEKNKIKLPIGTIITDYNTHELWISSKNQDYFVATPKIKWKLNQKGIPQENIFVSGIPVDPAFYEKKSIARLQQNYNIDKTRKTILVLSGGHGTTKIGKIIKILFGLAEQINIIAIAGKNKKMENKLKKLKPPSQIKFYPLGWTDAIDEYMRLSDLIITKPGGITATECITLGKPIIIIDPIPGQEEHNADYILSNGMGNVARNSADLLYYAHHPPAPKPQIDEVKNAAKIILDVIEKRLD